nr:hypothetical protein [Tanacetum cinerariifolium]
SVVLVALNDIAHLVILPLITVLPPLADVVSDFLKLVIGFADVVIVLLDSCPASLVPVPLLFAASIVLVP